MHTIGILSECMSLRQKINSQIVNSHIGDAHTKKSASVSLNQDLKVKPFIHPLFEFFFKFHWNLLIQCRDKTGHL